MRQASYKQFRSLGGVPGSLLAYIVFAIGLALAVAAWRYAVTGEQQQLRDHFNFRTNEVIAATHERMATYRQVLRGGVGLFDASERVTREDWAAYVAQLNIGRDFPGIQGMGFSLLIPAAGLERHEQAMRAAGYEDYQVRPPDERDFYSAIVFLEPFDWRNQRAFGFDMFNEPVRREAMMRALDTGQPALSGQVTLVQETEEDVQAGFLLYLPVYAGGGTPATVAERRERLVGWVYAPFRAGDLMREVLDSSSDDLRLRVYDGLGLRPDHLMYDSHPGEETAVEGAPARVVSLRIDGRSWTLYITALPEFGVGISWGTNFVLAAGILLSLLLALLVGNLASTRARAMALADDITAALRQSEERFRVALKDTNIAVYNQDRDLRYTWLFNPGHGIDPERVVGKTDQQVGTPERQIALKRKVLQEGVGVHEEVERVILGRRYTFSLTLEPLREEGEVVGLTAAAVDITSLKRVQRDLQESEERFRTMFENAGVGLVLTDTVEGKLLAVNPAFEHMLGYSERELRELPVRSLVYADDRRPLADVLQQLRRSERNAFRVQERYVRKDGRLIVGSLTASLVHDPEGKPRYLLWMVEDITDLRLAEQRLQRAYAELEQRVEQRTAELSRRTAELERSNAELEQFAYVASHDLQEPLRTVASFAQLLEQRYREQLDDSAREYLDYVVTGSQRMRELIKDLLAFSRVGAGAPAPVEVALEGVLQAALDNLQGAIRDSGAVVSHDPLPVVLGDSGDLLQLLQNLIANAVKFRGVEPPRVHVGVEDGGTEWRFVVRDNGIGISPDQFERIFTLFHRLHLDHEYAGTGIGLASCRKIVGRHGGRIWVESNPGAGASFWFTLPK